MKMKRCHECDMLLPLAAFYRASDLPDGRRKTCITCRNAEYMIKNNSGKLGDDLYKRWKQCIASHDRVGKSRGVSTLSFLRYSILMLSDSCAACGRQYTTELKRVIDRVDNNKPLSNENTWSICAECNLSKSNKDGLYLLKLAYAVLEKEGRLREVDVD